MYKTLRQNKKLICQIVCCCSSTFTFWLLFFTYTTCLLLSCISLFLVSCLQLYSVMTQEIQTRPRREAFLCKTNPTLEALASGSDGDPNTSNQLNLLKLVSFVRRKESWIEVVLLLTSVRTSSSTYSLNGIYWFHILLSVLLALKLERQAWLRDLCPAVLLNLAQPQVRTKLQIIICFNELFEIAEYSVRFGCSEFASRHCSHFPFRLTIYCSNYGYTWWYYVTHGLFFVFF